VTPEDAVALADVQLRSYEAAQPGLRASWPAEQALDAEGMRELLGRHRYAVLATARPDGRPQAAPVGFLVAEGAFWIGTVAGGRLRNLRARRWASLVVMEGDPAEGSARQPHRAITVEGPVELHEDGAFDAALARIEQRWLERHGRSPGWAVALVELHPERVFSHASSL
jgi:nitroimidazol reductase NimA-like FMN-containing flavoprotein (pyridoxamine 5'-phosphate oxidase superfamily)